MRGRCDVFQNFSAGLIGPNSSDFIKAFFIFGRRRSGDTWARPGSAGAGAIAAAARLSLGAGELIDQTTMSRLSSERHGLKDHHAQRDHDDQNHRVWQRHPKLRDNFYFPVRNSFCQGRRQIAPALGPCVRRLDVSKDFCNSSSPF